MAHDHQSWKRSQKFVTLFFSAVYFSWICYMNLLAMSKQMNVLFQERDGTGTKLVNVGVDVSHMWQLLLRVVTSRVQVGSMVDLDHDLINVSVPRCILGLGTSQFLGPSPNRYSEPDWVCADSQPNYVLHCILGCRGICVWPIPDLDLTINGA